MVFQDLKRAPRPRLPHEKTNLLHLPAEIHLQILDSGLSVLDILRLRATHSDFTPLCTSTLAEQATRLYIHPSAVSMKRVQKICAHPLLARNVTEVVLLGEVRWKEIDQAWKEYRTMDEERTRKKTIREEWGGGRFRAWPLLYPTGKVQNDKKRSVAAEAEAVVPSFGEAYAPLIKALEQLPKLRKISFADRVQGSGWNQTKRDAISTFARRQSQWPALPDEKVKARKFIRITARADAEVLLGLLTCPALPVLTELVLTAELPFVAGLLQEQSTLGRLAQLTSIELHFDSFWMPGTKWHTFCHALLANAKQLQHLKLVYKPNSYVTSALTDQSCAAVLSTSLTDERPLLWEGLRSFALVNKSDAENGDASRSRPLCLLFDLAAFLARHAGTLETVELGNVVFSTPYELPTDALRSGLRALEKCERLREVEWRVNKFGHHEKCRREKSEAIMFGECVRKLQCGVYYHSDLGWRECVRHVERVAEELDVELDEEGKGWDFGKAVRVWR
ncbi:hypothetical protein B0A55_13446 [Friedmanniomyces simplex]|uniref:Uncharacterized protein n=1 Tax=Friedmanniomyces simplex TaxID=329884 RepID=A0A4U0W304_9PEZI|nr:hypothetical protein B0A55_13446 [Friedmanniomyces simplex]